MKGRLLPEKLIELENNARIKIEAFNTKLNTRFFDSTDVIFTHPIINELNNILNNNHDASIFALIKDKQWPYLLLTVELNSWLLKIKNKKPLLSEDILKPLDEIEKIVKNILNTHCQSKRFPRKDLKFDVLLTYYDQDKINVEYNYNKIIILKSHEKIPINKEKDALYIQPSATEETLKIIAFHEEQPQEFASPDDRYKHLMSIVNVAANNTVAILDQNVIKEIITICNYTRSLSDIAFLEKIKNVSANNEDAPILIKCRDKIYVYGLLEVKDEISEGWIFKRKLTEIYVNQSPILLTKLPFPTEENKYILINRNNISNKIYEIIRQNKAHNKSMDDFLSNYVRREINKTAYHLFYDTFADMILLDIHRILKSLIPKNDFEKKLYSEMADRLWDIKHVDKKPSVDDASSKESYSGENTYLGLADILNYIYADNNRKNSKLGEIISLYLQSMNLKNDFVSDIHLDTKTKKDIEKGIIRNRQGKFSPNDIQYALLDVTHKSQASKNMQKLLENLIDNLYYHNEADNSLVKYNDRNECKIYIKRNNIILKNNKNAEKEFDVFNVTQLLRDNPVAHEINISKSRRDYFYTAMFGCNLYLSPLKSITKEMVAMASPNSCILLYHKNPETQKLSINEIYYIDPKGNLELVTIDKKEKTDIFKNIATFISPYSETILKENDNLTLIEKPPERNKNSDLLVALINDLNTVLAKARILFLRPTFYFKTSLGLQCLNSLKTKAKYFLLSPEEAAAIRAYTSAYYLLLNPFIRSNAKYRFTEADFDKTLPGAKYLFNQHEEEIKNNLKGVITNDHFLYRLISELLIYDYFTGYGLSMIKQAQRINEYKKAKNQFNSDNCDIYIVNKLSKVTEACEDARKKYAIILYRPIMEAGIDEQNIITIFFAEDKKLKNKIMPGKNASSAINEETLRVTLEVDAFFPHVINNMYDPIKSAHGNVPNNKIIPLLYNLTRSKKGLLQLEDKIDRDLVNVVIKIAIGHCLINICNTELCRTDKENSYVNNVRNKIVAEWIKKNGLAIDATRQYISTSAGAIQFFLTTEGQEILTKILSPDSNIADIIDLSLSPAELEALYKSKIAYYKMRGEDNSLTNTTYYGLILDDGFNPNTPKWKKFINAQIQSEISANINLSQFNLANKKIAIKKAFKEFKEKNHVIIPTHLESYFTSDEEYNGLVQKSCLLGTPLIVMPANGNGIKKQTKNITNTYILYTSPHDGEIKYKLYYITMDHEVIPIYHPASLTASDSDEILQKELASHKNLSVSTRRTKLLSDPAKKIIANHIKKYNDENKRRNIPLLTGFINNVKLNQKINKRKSIAIFANPTELLPDEKMIAGNKLLTLLDEKIKLENEIDEYTEKLKEFNILEKSKEKNPDRNYLNLIKEEWESVIHKANAIIIFLENKISKSKNKIKKHRMEKQIEFIKFIINNFEYNQDDLFAKIDFHLSIVLENLDETIKGVNKTSSGNIDLLLVLQLIKKIYKFNLDRLSSLEEKKQYKLAEWTSQQFSPSKIKNILHNKYQIESPTRTARKPFDLRIKSSSQKLIDIIIVKYNEYKHITQPWLSAPNTVNKDTSVIDEVVDVIIKNNFDDEASIKNCYDKIARLSTDLLETAIWTQEKRAYADVINACIGFISQLSPAAPIQQIDYSRNKKVTFTARKKLTFDSKNT